jgi:hypothetical protein
MRLRITIAALAALVFAASAEAATLTVSPVSGARGSWLTVRGLDFPGSRAGTLTFARRTVRIRTSRGGGFARALQVPARSTLGGKRIVATVGGRSIVAVFRVVRRTSQFSSSTTVSSTGRRLSLTPTTGSAGTTVTLRGAGFPKGRRVLIAFGATGQAPARTNRRGSFGTSFSVPNVSAGTRWITVRAGRATLRTLFAVRSCGGRVIVCLPYRLEFNQGSRGLPDARGVETGFTHVARGARGGRFMRGNVTLDTGPGTLAIRTTAGLAIRGTNSGDNVLGVGLEGPRQVSVVQTTLLNPPPGTRKYEQGGLWFGTDQDNYVKLVVISHQVLGTRVQLLLEVAGNRRRAAVSPPVNVTNAQVTLTLRANPSTRRVSARFSIDGGQARAVRAMTVPGEFFSFNATGTNPRIGTKTFAGIFASHRFGRQQTWTFDRFAVVRP